MGLDLQFALGGLLQGVGKGISDEYERRREEALNDLRYSRAQDIRREDRQWQTEDRDLRLQAEADARESAEEARRDQLEVAGALKRDEIKLASEARRKEREVDYTYDVKLEEVRAKLDMRKDAASKQLSERLSEDDVQSTHIAEDGSLVVLTKGGSIERHPKVKLNFKKPDADDESESSIDRARGRGGNDGGASGVERGSSLGSAAGAAVRPQSSEPPVETSKLKADLGNLIAKINSDPAFAEEARRRYPQMFNPDGSLKSNSELLARLDQYGR
jgi:hypothetical protein